MTTVAYGLQNDKPKTVSLTDYQYQQFEEYCNNFHTRLTQATTQQEVMLLFKEAVGVLHSYDLLPAGMTLPQAQHMVERLAQISQRGNTQANIYHSQTGNHFCLITGHTTQTWFTSPLYASLFALLWLLQKHDTLVFLLFAVIMMDDLVNQFIPLAPFDVISFGEAWTDSWEGQWHDAYSEGWVHTFGFGGAHDWNGTFKGALAIDIPGGSHLYSDLYPGATGFIGIKTESLYRSSFYLGLALNVQLNNVSTAN
ncbi:MAG TPA: hypothetical protein VMT57_02210 [Candidatus Thermoplasmatota archaeon]|nr:hypothetical protein [Candidatus Thermoplasmatota archaeon]